MQNLSTRRKAELATQDPHCCSCACRSRLSTSQPRLLTHSPRCARLLGWWRFCPTDDSPSSALKAGSWLAGVCSLAPCWLAPSSTVSKAFAQQSMLVDSGHPPSHPCSCWPSHQLADETGPALPCPAPLCSAFSSARCSTHTGGTAFDRETLPYPTCSAAVHALWSSAP